MPIVRPSVAPRVLLLVALVVLALLLAPVADVADGTAAPSRATSAERGGAPEAGAGSGTHAEAVSAKRRAKKKARKHRKTRASSTGAAAAVTAPRWSTATLTYHDGLPEQWAWSLRTAVDQWNAAGVGITLQPVADPAAAQVRIAYGDIGAVSGLATVGPVADAYVKLSDRYRTAAADQYDRVEVMGVLAHELGHVLGLHHVTTGCALMGPLMDIVGCGIYDMAQPDAYRCDVLDAAALAEAARLYGGTGRGPVAGSCVVGG